MLEPDADELELLPVEAVLDDFESDLLLSVLDVSALAVSVLASDLLSDLDSSDFEVLPSLLLAATGANVGTACTNLPGTALDGTSSVRPASTSCTDTSLATTTRPDSTCTFRLDDWSLQTGGQLFCCATYSVPRMPIVAVGVFSR